MGFRMSFFPVRALVFSITARKVLLLRISSGNFKPALRVFSIYNLAQKPLLRLLFNAINFFVSYKHLIASR